MDIQLTEEEQKIYDNLVKYFSGEYKNTEYEIIASCCGRYGIELERFSDFNRWWIGKGAIWNKIQISNTYFSESAVLENWRQILKDDFFAVFDSDYKLINNSMSSYNNFLLTAYTGMLKYGSPENYLKQVAASRVADEGRQ